MSEPKRLSRILNLDDFQHAAKRRLPPPLYGFAASGAEDGRSLAAARDAFAALALRPRMLAGVGVPDMGVELLGRRYAAPFGIAPMGGTALYARDCDGVLAEAAAGADIPFVLSGASTVPMERIAKRAPGSWFQAYIPADLDAIDALVDRVAATGIDHLVITVDVPTPSNRESDRRTGFGLPFAMTPRLFSGFARYPGWLWRVGRHLFGRDPARYANFDAGPGQPLLQGPVRRPDQDRRSMHWSHLIHIRGRWAGKLIVKGILRGDDAARARECGADAVIVSGHGGRQLDAAIAPLAALSDVVAAVPGMPVILDGGVRRGTDVMKALALGAHMVMAGRPFLFSAATAGAAGVDRAIMLLRAEVERDMILAGCKTIADIGADMVISASAFTGAWRASADDRP